MYCKLCGKKVDKLEDGLCEECKIKRMDYLKNNRHNVDSNNEVQFKIRVKSNTSNDIDTNSNNDNLRNIIQKDNSGIYNDKNLMNENLLNNQSDLINASLKEGYNIAMIANNIAKIFLIIRVVIPVIFGGLAIMMLLSIITTLAGLFLPFLSIGFFALPILEPMTKLLELAKTEVGIILLDFCIPIITLILLIVGEKLYYGNINSATEKRKYQHSDSLILIFFMSLFIIYSFYKHIML